MTGNTSGTGDSGHRPGESGRVGLFAGASFAGLVAAVVFVGFPEIDLWVASQFSFGPQAFYWNLPGPGKDLRLVFQVIFWAAGLAALAGLVLTIYHRRRLATFGFPQWLFLGLCLVLGPGVVANVVLKDNWGRARPFHVHELGGQQAFTPALVRSTSCRNNCSFVSGEAAAIYALFFALAMLMRRRRARLIALGVGAGTLAGVVRMAQGGHFLSDVIFAGVFMALLVRALYWVLFEWREALFREGGPVHEYLSLGSHKTVAGTGRLAHGFVSHARGRWGPGAQKGLEALTRRRMLPNLGRRGSAKVPQKTLGSSERPRLESSDEHRPD